MSEAQGRMNIPDSKTVDTRELWRRYKRDGDQAARESLVLAYSPMVKFIAGRMASGLPAHVDESDLVSYGLFGLIGAIERFEPDREIKFETFASSRIRGAIIDELRALDWVPRSVRARARDIEAMHAKLSAKFGRTPTDDEMAEGLGIDREEFDQTLLDIANSQVLALDDLWAFSDPEGGRVSTLEMIEDQKAPNPEREVDLEDLRNRLASALDQLPERERVVVALYYYESLTLREIGEVLSVSESRVCQLHTKAMIGLRANLKREHV